ncbi:hypothetical protein [Bacillus mesophilum]|uniref:Uncharacterized protein n=1 Tax=Bacillus mesophilum TaxID=1071718 RepID=A0A7V7UVV8_9BACI|nr:hypothetical protein [Bacillus mesophilum]KAB2332930.1 hypothetical protein F7732_12680 [Bacillus mesophilum]
MTAFRYEIIRGSGFRQPQITRVIFDDGSTAEFKLGHYLSKRKIIELLPRMVMDSRDLRRKAV